MGCRLVLVLFNMMSLLIIWGELLRFEERSMGNEEVETKPMI